jgi:predicted amidohydrolase
MRVVVSQFATSLNTQENLASCLRVISNAASCQPDLILLPEFCNTLSWYRDHNQAWNEALPENSDFLQRIAEQAKEHSCYIVLNVTLRRDPSRGHQNGTIKSNISVTSCLFSPLGELIQQVDKQTLSHHESDFFICTSDVPKLITTSFGAIGLLTGNDDTNFMPSRELALRGAQLLCQSTNTLTQEQSSLYCPARASENKVFFAVSNKVGPLVPQEFIQHQEGLSNSTQNNIPESYFMGVGQSQIISPEGKVLAKIDSREEGYVYADIDLSADNIDSNKCRPDGTNVIEQRRSVLYDQLEQAASAVPHKVDINVPETVNVAIFATYKPNEQAIEDVCHYIENNLSDIIQLPELFFIADKTITHSAEQRELIASLSELLISQISSVLRPFQYVCTSLIINEKHQAVLISEHGVFAKQQQLHFCQRYQWTELGDEVNVIELPLEQGSINVAMLTADDVNVPEVVNMTALSHLHLLLVPFDIQESCEVNSSLLSRAAEHRICILAASREKSFADDLPKENSDNIYGKNKVKQQKSTGFIANLTEDFTLSTCWNAKKFDGYVNQPLVKHQHGKITKAIIHPARSCNKLLVRKIAFSDLD